jgi:hypothetical protein
MSKILKYQKKENLLATENLYTKSFIRGSILGKKNTNFLDNSLFFSSFINTNDNIPDFLNVKPVIFKNIYFTPVHFLHNVSFFQNDFSLLILSLNKALLTLNKLKIEKVHLFLLKPLKAGFRCVFNGIFGFIFLKSLESIWVSFEINIKKTLNIKKIMFLNNFYKNYLNLFLKPTTSITFEFLFLPCLKRKKFSKRFKTFKFSNFLNIVFLAKD